MIHTNVQQAVREERTLEDIIGSFTTLLMQMGDVNLPVRLAGLLMQFANELHGFARQYAEHQVVVGIDPGKVEELRSYLQASLQHTMVSLPPATTLAIAPPAAPEPEPEPDRRVVVETSPFEGDRKDIPCSVDRLMQLYEGDAEEPRDVTRLPTDELLRVVAGVLTSFSTLLDRFDAEPSNRRSVADAQEATERAALAVHRRAAEVRVLHVRAGDPDTARLASRRRKDITTIDEEEAEAGSAVPAAAPLPPKPKRRYAARTEAQRLAQSAAMKASWERKRAGIPPKRAAAGPVNAV